MAEEIATLDHIDQGRLNMGIGRSGSPWAYEGYNISYAELSGTLSGILRRDEAGVDRRTLLL